ncbi:MAG TPA: hypothetical protein VFV00_19395 [Acidimicrobiales bacterium]|nr:hypothetical protein [Acidimicrobiales bacterium]
MGDVARDAMHDNDTRQPVEFDPETMRLTIGEHSTVVSHPALGNEAVLRSYLSLVGQVRGTPIGSGIEIRHDDVVVLAQVLDLNDADLEMDLERLLGVSPATAAEVGRRLRRRHAFVAAAASLTVGGLALFGATKVAAAPSPATVRPAAVVTATAADVAEPTTTSTVVAAPTTTEPVAPVDTTPEAPATTEPAAPETHTHPSGPDDVQIGDALVIERGQQPADPSTQIGDAVTYER